MDLLETNIVSNYGEGGDLHDLLMKEYRNLPEVRDTVVENAKKFIEDGAFEEEENIREAAVSFYRCWQGLL